MARSSRTIAWRNRTIARFSGCAGLAMTGLLASSAAASDFDAAAVRAELHQLRNRIAELERLLDTAAPQPAPDPSATVLLSEPMPATGANSMATLRTGDAQTAAQPTATVRTADPADSADSAEKRIEFGGAVRLSYAWQDYNDRDQDRGGNFELELVSISADGESGPFTLSAEYRWYNGFEAIHHAWIGYAFAASWEARLGVSQVPFGLLPFASHSFWFSTGYYLGFEDDYDAGLQLIYDNAPWRGHLAFFKNAEYADSSRADRYSFDLVTGGAQQNDEINQWNARLAYRWDHGGNRYSEPGISVQWGQLYNATSGRNGSQRALALHWDGHYGPWNLQLQWARYHFDPANPPGVSKETVQLAAFGFPFMAAAEADIAVANLAYTFKPRTTLIDSITCYNDYSEVAPAGRGQDKSVQNITGCLLTAGAIYTYVDWITGKNMWFINGTGVGLDGSEWQSRFNVNIGYYF